MRPPSKWFRVVLRPVSRIFAYHISALSNSSFSLSKK